MRGWVWLGAWTGLWGCWLILAGGAEVAELVAATVVASGATWVAWATVRHVPLELRAPARWWSRAGRIALNTLRDSWIVLGCAFRRRLPQGKTQVLELGPPPKDASPEALDGWLTNAVSVSPNTVVIGLDPARGRAVVHQLVETGAAELETELRLLW